MKRTKFTVLALGTILSFAACSKKDSTSTTTTTTPPATPTIVGTWKIDAITSDVSVKKNGVMTTNLLDDCEKDDLWLFKDGSDWEIDEGAVKCNSGNPQISYSQWVKSNDTLVLGVSTKLTFKIISVDATTLKMSYSGYYFSSSIDSTKNTSTYTMTRR